MMLILMPLFALPFLYAFVFPDLIGDHASACTDSASDQRSFSSTQQRASHRASGCRTANDFGRGVVTTVVRCLRPLRALMPLRRCLLRKT